MYRNLFQETIENGYPSSDKESKHFNMLDEIPPRHIRHFDEMRQRDESNRYEGIY